MLAPKKIVLLKMRNFLVIGVGEKIFLYRTSEIVSRQREPPKVVVGSST